MSHWVLIVSGCTLSNKNRLPPSVMTSYSFLYRLHRSFIASPSRQNWRRPLSDRNLTPITIVYAGIAG